MRSRAAIRRTTAIPATVSAAHGQHSAMLCNLSPTGAKLRLDRGSIPDREVRVSSAAFATPMLCRIVWRDGQELGLRFKLSAITSP